VRKSLPLSLLMLDLDHFKKWNDTRGHDAGDQVLRLVGTELQRAVRGSDIACRFGGEEFAILMPETPAAVAMDRADAIRERLGRLDVECGGQMAGRVTVSIGIACFPQHASDANSLVRAADAALYAAKAAGRDRVMLAEPLAPKASARA
jgi:diguanylate cyclase (GGDEF)-like protein